MDLDDYHRVRLESAKEARLLYAKAHRAKQWFTQEISRLVDEENMPRTKAEARVINGQKEGYEKMMDLTRQWNMRLEESLEDKSTYYKERDKRKEEKLLDIEASR